MTSTTRRALPALLLTAVVLAVAFAGGATAAGLITGKDIKNNTVTTKDIRNKTIKPADMKPLNGVVAVPFTSFFPAPFFLNGGPRATVWEDEAHPCCEPQLAGARPAAGVGGTGR